MSTATTEDFTNALDVMFWGTLYPTLAVLSQMRAQRGGRIVNITSIGGVVSIPHLLPYTCAKFAAVGLSEGLRAELGCVLAPRGGALHEYIRDGGAAAPSLPPPARPDRSGSGGRSPPVPAYTRRCSVGALASGTATLSLSRCTLGLRLRVNAAVCSIW